LFSFKASKKLSATFSFHSACKQHHNKQQHKSAMEIQSRRITRKGGRGLYLLQSFHEHVVKVTKLLIKHQERKIILVWNENLKFKKKFNLTVFFQIHFHLFLDYCYIIISFRKEMLCEIFTQKADIYNFTNTQSTLPSTLPHWCKITLISV
jgi:hypothetical protein